MIACPACAVDNTDDAWRCASCGVIVPPARGLSPFSRLGLADDINVDDATVERAWLSRSRYVHPDKHQQRPPNERRAAAEHTAALNDAYRALKTPFSRAATLVGMRGASEPKTSQALLMQLMELRETSEESPEARARVAAEAEQRFRDGLTALTALLADVDVDARKAAAHLAELRMWGRLCEDTGGPPLVSATR